MPLVPSPTPYALFNDLRPTGGDKGIRTPDPLLAKQVLSQLSYVPTRGGPGKTRTSDLTLIRRAL